MSMPQPLERVRAITLADIQEARTRIARTIVRTPLLRFEMGPDYPDILLKLENLQPTNSYKLRGAVIVVETAPASKIERMRALGARLIPVPYAVAWKALGDRAFPGVDGTFVHPFDDHNFIAGHATMGLEIFEDAPDAVAVIAAIGGGGLITGVGSALKALNSRIKVWGAEPDTAAPAALSLAKGSPQVFKDWKPSFVDGAGGQSLFPRMWERMRPVVDSCIVVNLDETKRAMRLMAEKARVIVEGAGALPVAAALTGKAGRGPIVAIVSGGNLDMMKFCELISSAWPPPIVR